MKIIFNFLSEQEDHNAVSSAPVVKRVLFFVLIVNILKKFVIHVNK